MAEVGRVSFADVAGRKDPRRTMTGSPDADVAGGPAEVGVVEGRGAEEGGGGRLGCEGAARRIVFFCLQRSKISEKTSTLIIVRTIFLSKKHDFVCVPQTDTGKTMLTWTGINSRPGSLRLREN